MLFGIAHQSRHRAVVVGQLCAVMLDVSLDGHDAASLDAGQLVAPHRYVVDEVHHGIGFGNVQANGRVAQNQVLQLVLRIVASLIYL